MALSTVITHATGDVFPASDWNIYIRDNVNFLGVAGADLASATTITPTNKTHLVTGTTTIDNVSTTGAVKGQEVKLIFQGTTTVRHNGGGTGNIRLIGGLHAGFIANETLVLTYDGTNWIEDSRSPLHLSGEEVTMANVFTSAAYPIEDGSAISRTTYAALFANVGTIHGVGDGSTTFNLADSRGRVTVAYAPSGGHTDVATVGNKDGVAVAFRRPKHKHSPHTHSMSPNNDFNSPNNIVDGGNTTGGQTTSAYSVGVSSVDGGSGNTNDSLDAPAYIVKPRYVRI